MRQAACGSFGSDLVLSEQLPQSQWSGILALALTEILEGVVRTAIYGSSVDRCAVYLA